VEIDNYTRVIHPFGLDLHEAVPVARKDQCPRLQLFWGVARKVSARDPDVDPQAAAIRNKELREGRPGRALAACVQLEMFLRETKSFAQREWI
jgi:hypothetical protein